MSKEFVAALDRLAHSGKPAKPAKSSAGVPMTAEERHDMHIAHIVATVPYDHLLPAGHVRAVCGMGINDRLIGQAISPNNLVRR